MKYYKNMLRGILLIFLFIPLTLNATVLFLYINNRAIYLGADSKLTGGNSDTITKIRKSGEFCFAFAGLTEIPMSRKNNLKAFDLPSKIDQVIQRQKTYDSISKHLPVIVKNYIYDYFINIRKLDPAGFRALPEVVSKEPIQVLVTGVVNKIPTVLILEYNLEDSDTLVRLAQLKKTIENFDQSGDYEALGKVRYKFFEEDLINKGLIQDKPICFLAQSIQRCIVKYPDSVGRPIKAISVTSTGIEFHDPVDDCGIKFYRNP